MNTKSIKSLENKELKIPAQKPHLAPLKGKNRNHSTAARFLPPFRAICLKPSKTLKSSPFGLRFLCSELSFQVVGDYPDVIKELKLRGWRNAGNTSTKFQFIWSKYARIAKDYKENIIVNHISHIYELSTKDFLCENLRGISRSFFPECYIISRGNSEKFSFVFQQRFIENILKTLEKSAGSDAEVVDLITNSVHYKAIQTYLSGRLIATKAELTALVSDLQKDSQSCIQGTQNMWIVKPDKLSRGRGIKIMNDLNSIKSYTSQGSWVIQKYIESPLLINRRKFDIRQWVLVTCNASFEVHFYKKCYLRFSSEIYDVNDTENLFMHLTNNSVVKYSSNFREEDSMWDSDQFSNWVLQETGQDLWKSISKRASEIVQKTILAVKSKISQRRRCFELLGYDFMIDTQYNPWLIEINTSPALDYSTVRFIQPVTERLVKEMIPHVFNIIFDETGDTSEYFLKLQV